MFPIEYLVTVEVKSQKKWFILKNAEEIDIDPHASFSQYNSKLPNVSCQTREPDFINPNVYHNIIQVIQAIGFRSGIRQYGQGNWEWLMIECNGLPCNILRDIIDNVWTCTICNDCFHDIENFQEHMCYNQ